jgi:hypothetical protein
MANLVKVGNIKTSFVFLGEHCEIQVCFLDKTANAPVTVTRPSFKVLDSNGNEVSLRILKPLSPMSNKEGYYKVTFLSNSGLSVGTYTIVFSGYYPDDSKPKNKIEITSQIEILAVDNVQIKMDLLQRRVHDHITELYQIDDPEQYKFDEGDLYNALKLASDRWNEEPPTTEFGVNNLASTVDNFPFPALELDIAEYYLLTPEIILEIWNTISYSDDVQFNINRAPMLQSYVQMKMQNVEQRLKAIKKDWVWRNTRVKGIKSTKIPTRALRQLSFVPQLSFISTGGY